MNPVLLIVFTIVSFCLILFILFSKGKSSVESSSNFNISSTFFGSSGSTNFFSKFIIILSSIFFFTSIILNKKISDYCLYSEIRKSLVKNEKFLNKTEKYERQNEVPN
ncbi:hypothetical protein AOQ88_00920 [Candidatus Riesia sp. GBBU]|nr:hypothetical protein AOQ88_00920 [Candidatus Riesia sp. GBBU]